MGEGALNSGGCMHAPAHTNVPQFLFCILCSDDPYTTHNSDADFTADIDVTATNEGPEAKADHLMEIFLVN